MDYDEILCPVLCIFSKTGVVVVGEGTIEGFYRAHVNILKSLLCIVVQVHIQNTSKCLENI